MTVTRLYYHLPLKQSVDIKLLHIYTCQQNVRLIWAQQLDTASHNTAAAAHCSN